MDELDDIFDEKDLSVEEIIESPQYNKPLDDDIFNDFTPSNSDKTILDSLLKNKGITDGKIKIVDEDNKKQEIDFYSLSEKEQLDILISSEQDENHGLDNTELELVNYLRTNNLSVEDFLSQYKESILAEIQNPEPSYDIDNYNDQELFLLDLKNKFDLTDDELVAELEKELKNEDIFNKKITKLRTEYKELEDNYKQNEQLEFQKNKEQEYNTFVQSMVDIAIKTPEFHGIDLEEDDKNETLSYLLELDENGISKFHKDLNNPNKLYEAAWYLRYGKEAFDAIKNAYESEIAKLKKQDKPRVIVQSPKNQANNIHDLF